MWFPAGWTISRMRLPPFTPRFCISGRYYFFATSSFLRFFFSAEIWWQPHLGQQAPVFLQRSFSVFCFFCSEGRNSFPLLPLCCPTEIAILREILKGKNKISVWGNTWVKKKIKMKFQWLAEGEKRNCNLRGIPPLSKKSKSGSENPTSFQGQKKSKSKCNGQLISLIRILFSQEITLHPLTKK